MARTHGNSSEYLLGQASKTTTRILICCFLAIALVSWAAGFFFNLHGHEPIYSAISFAAVLVIIWGTSRWFERKAGELEKVRHRWRSGAVGEAIVAQVLTRLSNRYFVFHNLVTPFGDFDHLVVGPTGIYAIETKNWRGLVAADNVGELLLNGRGTGKPVIRNFLIRLMNLRTQVCQWTQRDDFFQPVFVFTAARVEAKFGTTKNVHCLREEQLLEYVENTKSNHLLPRAAVVQITKVLYGFAQMKSSNLSEPLAPPVPTKTTC